MTRELSGQWFAAQVWSGREHLATNHLRSRGYEIFCPRYYEYRRWSDRVKRIERPLFVGYVFCRLDGDALGKVVTAPHVIRIIGDEQGPLSIPTPEIDAIRRVVDADLEAEPWPFPHVGERVWIAVGPLTGTEGVVLRTKGHNRLILSIALLQRSVAVEVDAEWVATSSAGLHK
jgi:transcription antitermination factor NusG